MDLSTRLHLPCPLPSSLFSNLLPLLSIPYLFVSSARILLSRHAAGTLSFLEAHQRLTKYLARSSSTPFPTEEAAAAAARRFKRYCFTPRGKRGKREEELAGNSFVSIPNCRNKIELRMDFFFLSFFPTAYVCFFFCRREMRR